LTFQVVIFMPGRRLRIQAAAAFAAMAADGNRRRAPARLACPREPLSDGAMRSSWTWSLPTWLLLPLLLPACATKTYVVATDADAVVGIDACADDLATADVVVLGEQHGTPAVHRVHHALIAELHERRPNLAIAMEMFERDTQTVLLQYLTGFIDESGFLARARAWPSYARDYRPIVEFAKANGLVVLAANAPRALARRAAKEGVGTVLGDPNVARETSAPDDDYREAFVEAMKGHPGSTADTLQREYAAQCLKDDTMAETVIDHIRERRGEGDRPLVVLVCGQMHSDYRRGAVARIASRMPELVVRVLSVETVDDVASGMYSSPRAIADYVVVAQRDAREPAPVPVPTVAAPSEPEPAPRAPAAAKPGSVPAKPPVAPPAEDAPRPGLGIQPDYDAGDAGIRVAAVTPGGPAEAAGIEADDVILEIGDVRVTDIHEYMDALNAHAVGKTIPVRVRRLGSEVVLRVKLAARSR
jgi:uncharacterized iron-regulated protein